MSTKHPNKRSFTGVLTRLDLPSDKAPGGSDGHRVLVTTEAAVAALDSLNVTPIGFGKCWTVHDYQQRCGITTEAWIEGDELRVRGYIFERDFPQVIRMIEGGKIGMSYEIATASVKDKRDDIWVLSNIIFSGAAILYADKAAYRTTSISLDASGTGLVEIGCELSLIDVREE